MEEAKASMLRSITYIPVEFIATVRSLLTDISVEYREQTHRTKAGFQNPPECMSTKRGLKNIHAIHKRYLHIPRFIAKKKYSS